MISLSPVPRALVPTDTETAHRVSAPNYDEFQSDEEVWRLLRERPDCVLRVTMAHCLADTPDDFLVDGSDEALRRAGEQMRQLQDGSLMREAANVLWVYEIVSPRRPELRQIGLGGMAATNQIRTKQQPDGSIIRNEGIRQEKADGRARLIEATGAYIGTVNLAVRDQEGQLVAGLEAIADARSEDYAANDEAGNVHRVWLITDVDQQRGLIDLLAREPAAYVADGNHRSAAAAALGHDRFLAVFFPTDRLHLEPYNRLVSAEGLDTASFLEQVKERFDVEELGVLEQYRPERVHEIGLYVPPGGWYRLTPREGTFDPDDAAASIDSDIVQKNLFDAVLGIADARDKRLNFVGGNKDSLWLKGQVDAGHYDFALSLAPVTMEQFVAVCEQNRFMPPKSTWFDPKIRSGLVIALLDSTG